ncbi:MAG: SUF system NifU family Fe-S cluster assembly protein [Rhodospirillales bacterium]|nr:SUF system NifU family Fe-S cluster assembly protein [Alphaproteobacteria bacterium]MBL6948587.1 SUF system NifU family Fe-S cluster assembly protein [Rhodospirillales bacterium]
MFDELRDLYQEVILDHGKNPRNFRRPEDATCLAHGNNPVCGDTLVIYLTLDSDERIQDAAFQGQGCAISVASASMMTDILKGKTATEAKRLFEGFHNMCTRDDFDISQLSDCDEDAIDRLVMLSGVKEFPIRVKCATLAWHTMQAAVSGDEETSTE